jgi:GntR family transcriptional regulator/MocR family aminotransferase
VIGERQRYRDLAVVLLAELHGNICDYLRAAREQFVIMTGTQQAIDIAIRVLLAPGDEVWFEDPGYPLTHALLLLAKAGLHPFPSMPNV